MDIINCHRCGKLFPANGEDLCPACLEAEEAAFAAVRAYLMERPGARIDQVARATGVRPETILRYLREGRLQPG